MNKILMCNCVDQPSPSFADVSVIHVESNIFLSYVVESWQLHKVFLAFNLSS